MSVPKPQVDAFTIERHGEITVIEASPGPRNDVADADRRGLALLLEPIRRQEMPLLLVDLSRVKSFGSTFLAPPDPLLEAGGLEGRDDGRLGRLRPVRDLLRITSLDVVWPIYADRREAMESLLAD